MAENQVPAVPTLTPGNQTSEHAVVKQSQLMSNIVMGVGAAISVISAISPSAHGTAATILGSIVALGGAFLNFMAAMGYNQGRVAQKQTYMVQSQAQPIAAQGITQGQN